MDIQQTMSESLTATQLLAPFLLQYGRCDDTDLVWFAASPLPSGPRPEPYHPGPSGIAV